MLSDPFRSKASFPGIRSFVSKIYKPIPINQQLFPGVKTPSLILNTITTDQVLHPWGLLDISTGLQSHPNGFIVQLPWLKGNPPFNNPVP